MNELTSERLAELAVLAMERTAFMFGEPADIDPHDLGAAARSATIRYTGSASGVIALTAGESFLRTLAANLLGVEPGEVSADQGVDALKELSNIIAGSVVAELGGRDHVFSLGLPESGPEPEGGDAGCRCCLDCEGEGLCVSWLPDEQIRAIAA